MSAFRMAIAVGAAMLATSTAAPCSTPDDARALDGPWRFHLGDDPAWARPDFDDRDWEQVDLTPAAGARDGDVGFSGYVPGWGARSHLGAHGFAWYRLAVDGSASALSAPLVVDDAYELYWNGAVLASTADFSSATPVVFSIPPRMVIVPPGRAVIAIRVWMGTGSWEEPLEPDAGGLHTAPWLGTPAQIGEVIDRQRSEIFRGYLVDAIEPLAFAMLALVLLVRRRDLSWLSIGLLVTALLRGNQVGFFWWQLESARVFDIARNVVLFPLAMYAWTRAWSAASTSPWRRRIDKAALALLLIEATFALLSRKQLFAWSEQSHALYVVAVAARCAYLPLWLTLWSGLTTTLRAAMLLVATGCYAAELGALGVPGIWFPFGTGVSRTQLAYAALIAVLSFVAIRARPRPSGGVRGDRVG